MISILIVDDDLYKISLIIGSIQNVYKGKLDVKQASNVQQALDILQKDHFHLIVSDLQMPLRDRESPIENGGEILIKEIYKDKNKCNVPMYVVGLTQFSELKHNFSRVWNVWTFDSISNDWQLKLRDLIFHIVKVDSKIVKSKTETIFVEGETDRLILTQSFNLFYKEFIGHISISSIKFGGGASWVERQLVIWGKTLFEKGKNEYLQAVGLFDNDRPGIDATKSLRKQIEHDSAENKTFSVISLSQNYAKHLIPIFAAGIILPITLEEMFPQFCWDYAKQKEWLVKRNLSEEILKEPTKWDKINQSLNQHLKSLSIPDNCKIYLEYKISDDSKGEFIKYIQSLESPHCEEALYAFKDMLNHILIKLKLIVV